MRWDVIRLTEYRGSSIEENFYYPFGLTLSTVGPHPAEKNNVKLTSKELQGDLGLNWYDFGARMQDMQIGRWLQSDPMGEKFKYESLYVYVGNNPINSIDIDGRLKLSISDNELSDIGLSRSELTRFNSIVNNLPNIMNDNALNAVSKTTGLSTTQIMKDLSANNGPKINLGMGIPYMANAAGGRVNLDVRVIKQLASMNSNSVDLSNQALGVALTLVHEYAHIGDQMTNGGANTGQFNIRGYRTIDGIEHEAANEHITTPDQFTGTPSLKYGSQEWILSPTGHRGTDATIIGFGVQTDFKGNGSINITKGSYPRTIKQSDLPQIPEGLP